MGPYLFAINVAIGFFGFAALYYFLLWRHSRRERILLVFAAHCTLLTAISGCYFAIATATNAEECRKALDRRADFAMLIQVTNVWLLLLLSGPRGVRFALFITALCLCLVTINILIWPITGIVIGIDRMLLPWDEEITRPLCGPANLGTYTAYLVLVSVQVFGLVAATRLWVRDRAAGFLAALASGGGLVAGFIGAAIDVFHANWPYVGVAPHAAWVILIALVVVHEYRRRGERLAASEKQFRTVFEQTLQLVGMLSVDGKMLMLNRTGLAAAGTREEEVIGKHLSEAPGWIDSPEEQKKLSQAVQAAARGETVRLDTIYRRPDKRVIDVDFSLKPMGDESGQVTQLLLEGRDMTKRKRAEEALRQSEERYRLIVQNQTEFVVKWLPDGTRTFANESYFRHFGISQEECIGTSFFSIVSPETRDSFLREIASLTPAQPEVTSEQLCMVAGGELRWQEWTRRGTFDARGKLVEVLSTGRDITRRKRVEEKLRESEERFRSAFDFALIGMGLVAPDGHWLRVNQSLCGLLGYTEAELLSLDFQSITHPDDLDKDLGFVRQMLEGSINCYQMEKRYRHKSGGVVWVLLSVSLLRDRKGEPLYFISQIQDITERHNAEETLRDYTRRLKALSHQILEAQETERRRLARELHDEIGQVLTTIGLRLHQVKSACSEELQSKLNEEIAFVNQAIAQVREMSLNLRPPMLDVLGLEATLRWYADLQRQRTALEIHIDGHLDGASPGPELAIACFRIVQESITNVLRHARARHLWIELEQEESELQVSVRDDGVGFDVAEMQKRAGQGGSFGILAMRERVELLGGRFDIESAPGSGTQIRAHFPNADAETPMEPGP